MLHMPYLLMGERSQIEIQFVAQKKNKKLPKISFTCVHTTALLFIAIQ